MAERPAKRTKLLSDDESDSPSDSPQQNGPALNINQEYARRFEHNSRRAELHRLEEKLGPQAAQKAGTGAASESESSSEEEDEDGELAQGALDQQFQAVLAAIKNKDPKIYDPQATFYSGIDDENAEAAPSASKKDKTMFLKDYQREKLLNGHAGQDEEGGNVEPTYAQQQEELKRTVTREIHAAADSDSEGDGADAEGGFLVAKPRVQEATARPATLSKEEIEHADENPEAFLSKFIETKAWVHTPGSGLHPLESDDDDEEERAEAIEEAYNMRFEDPDKANETLKTHARDTVAMLSTRKEKTNKRQRAREAERELKEAAKQDRAQDKARLRKLKTEEAQEKLERIKEAAGLGDAKIDVSEWQEFLTEDWDDGQWEKEMQKRFGDKYYAAGSDEGSEAEDDEESGDGEKKKKKKPRKPKWDDDIDIGDLIPDFDPDEEKQFSLSDDDGEKQEAQNGAEEAASEEEEGEGKGKGKKKQAKRDKAEEKRAARKQKRLVEQLVEEKMELDEVMDGVQNSKGGAGFRYRETSPVNFGMTPRDILMATDSQLNQFAGLKKMAAFREEDKKRKDRKRLGKKARLRQWRRDTFGNDQGPQKSLQDVVREELEAVKLGRKSKAGNGADAREGKRHTKRKRAAEA